MAAKKSTDSKAPAEKTTAPRGGDIKSAFEAAAAKSKTLKERPDNDTLLRIYSLYKQGAEGDVKGDRPGMFDFVAGAKYDAWAKLKGMGQDEAMKKYVDLILKLST